MKKHHIITAIFTALLVLIVTVPAKAQLSVNAHAGYHTLSPKLTDGGTKSGKLGFGAGLGYHHPFNETWGFATGLDFTSFGSTLKFDKINYSYQAFDAVENTDFLFKVETTKVEEKSTSLLLSLPLLARYTLWLGPPQGDLPAHQIDRNRNSLLFSGGLRFGFPISRNYTLKADNLETSGFYSFENQEYVNIPGVFFNQPLESRKGTYDANMHVQLVLEAAYRLKNRLSFGVYFNYGLNNVQDINDQRPVAFHFNNNQQPLSTNSLLNTAYTKSFKPLAVGVKVSYDLTSAKSSAEKAAEKVARQNAIDNELQQAELERSARERAEAERRELEARAEAERLARERAEAERAELERIAAAARAEADAERLAREKAEAEAEKNNIVMVRIRGVVADQKTNEPVRALVEVTNNQSGQLISTVHTDLNTGEYIVGLPVGSDYGIAFKAEGYLFASKYIDLRNTKVAGEIVQKVEIQKVEIGAQVVLNNIFYESGRTELTPESETELLDLVEMLSQNPTMLLEISGHTDNVGSLATNNRISQERAKSVVEHLVRKGIEGNRLTYRGYGPTQPVADNSTEEGRSINRRVEFKVTGI